MPQPSPSVQRSSPEFLRSLPGGPALLDWFGGSHAFHDATLRELTFSGDQVILVLDTFRLTDRTTGDGFLATECHCEVTMALRGIQGMHLESDGGATSIVDVLAIRREDAALVIEWQSSYGPHGRILATTIELALRPGDHREAT